VEGDGLQQWRDALQRQAGNGQQRLAGMDAQAVVHHGGAGCGQLDGRFGRQRAGYAVG
jgi:hypothetical protein